MNVQELLHSRAQASDLAHRPRRLRVNAAMRDMVRETRVNLGGLVQPLFIVSGEGRTEPISSMPGIKSPLRGNDPGSSSPPAHPRLG